MSPTQKGDNEATANSSFEDMSTRLEQIVRQLEGGNTSLVQSVKLYEEGAQLAQRCSKLLERAQLKVKKIQTDLNQQADAVADQAANYTSNNNNDDWS